MSLIKLVFRQELCILSLLSPVTLTLATNANPSLPNVYAQYVALNCIGRHTSTPSIQLPSNNLPAQKSKLTSSEHSATFHFSSKDTATQQLQIQATSQPPSMNSLSQLSGIDSVSSQCSKVNSLQSAGPTKYVTPSHSSTSSGIHPYIPQFSRYPFASGFPYSSQHSIRICFHAALSISRIFETLPCPHLLPFNQQQQSHPLPRSMPLFACCLMPVLNCF